MCFVFYFVWFVNFVVMLFGLGLPARFGEIVKPTWDGPQQVNRPSISKKTFQTTKHTKITKGEAKRWSLRYVFYLFCVVREFRG